MAFFQRLNRKIRSNKRKWNRQRSVIESTVVPQPFSPSGVVIATPQERSPQTHPASHGLARASSLMGKQDTLSEGEQSVNSAAAPLDLVTLCTSPRRRSNLPLDVLPDILYADSEAATLKNSPTLVFQADREMKSSISYCSELTDLTQIDDGLTDWGLPKVLVPMVQEVESPTTVSLGENTDTEFDAESMFGFNIDEVVTPDYAKQATITKTMSVVYLALLLQKSGVTPKRYQNKKSDAPALKARKSLSELQAEIEAEKVQKTFLQSFVPVLL